MVHMVCAVIQNKEEFGWCVHSMSISCLMTVYSMVYINYYARCAHIDVGMVQCIEQNACGISVRDTKTVRNRYQCKNQNCSQWILARNAKLVRTIYWRDGEEIHSGYRCTKA
jgi:hypothetical protein